MTKNILLSKPQTDKEFEAYYLLRYSILRKPWNQPLGSEKDENEDASFHLMASDENGNVLGVCRMQFNSEEEAQLRFMAVDEKAQGFGIGKKMMNYFEQEAFANGRKIIALQARENAVPFYEKCGFKIKEKTFLMWGQIQHYLMKKKLTSKL